MSLYKIVIIVKIIIIHSFLFYCLLCNHTFQTNPNSTTNFSKLFNYTAPSLPFYTFLQVHVCECLISQIPKDRFMKSFYPSLLRLARDDVANMRLAVGRVSHIGWLSGVAGNEIRALLSSNGSDRDVSFFAVPPSLRKDVEHLDYSEWKTREERYKEKKEKIKLEGGNEGGNGGVNGDGDGDDDEKGLLNGDSKRRSDTIDDVTF